MRELTELYKQFIGEYPTKEAVYKTLYEAIIKNILPPGYRIKDVELAETLKVSRSPIRETLQELLRKGLIETSKNGFIVKEFTPIECMDIVNYIKILRTETVRILESKITPSMIAYLETKILTPEKIREMKAEGRITDCYKEYQNFYYEMAKLTENPYIYSEMEMLQEKLLMMHYMYPQNYRDEFSSGHYAFYHRQIIDSFKGAPHLPPPHELTEQYCNRINVIRHMYNLRYDWAEI